MQSKKVLLIGVALMGLFAVESRAATFTPPSPGNLSFGSVPVGGFKTLDFDVSWSEDAGEGLFDYAAQGSFTAGGWSLVQQSCVGTKPGYSDGKCSYSLTIAPFAIGSYQLNSGFIILLRNNTEFQRWGLAATARGAPPVPIPAALPLLATGLGALGVLGWRRKRKLAQAQA